MTRTVKQIRDGIYEQNPVFVLLLGMCPALAVSTGLRGAVGMGLATTAVLLCSNILISGLRRLIPDKIRIAAFVIIIAGFVTAVDYLMQAYAPDLSELLGIFIPLIAVNCIVLARAEAFASKNGVARSALDALSMGAGFTLALMSVAFFRELLGAGALMDVRLLPEGFPGIALMARPAGGFITLGCVIAAAQALKIRSKGVSAP